MPQLKEEEQGKAPLTSWGEGLLFPPTKGLIEGSVPEDLSLIFHLDPLKLITSSHVFAGSKIERRYMCE